jgi:iron-sulfur cluster assembly accessory protein
MITITDKGAEKVHEFLDSQQADVSVVDNESLQFVRGSTIDYEESLQGAGFKVNNPNVVAACGCGSSFRVAEEEQVSAV